MTDCSFQAIADGLRGAGFSPDIHDLNHFQDDYGLNPINDDEDDEDDDEDDEDDEQEDESEDIEGNEGFEIVDGKEDEMDEN